MTLSGELTFKGSTPYELLQQDLLELDVNKNFRYLSLWSEPKTEFCVDEISGDGSEDVIIGVKLSDHCTNHTPVVIRTHGGLIKSGSGTLALTNEVNTFSGDIVVQEGTLQVGPNWQLNGSSLVSPYISNSTSDHWLGCLTNRNRRIVVKSGASLYFPNRNCFGSQGGITNLCTNINITLVFDGGVFTNYAGQGFILPNLEFSNGGSVAPGTGPGNYGRFMVKERFTVKGSIPFEWNLSSAAHNKVSQMTQEALSINGFPENVFDIADVTGDSASDATFGIPFMIGYGYFRNDTADGDHNIDDWKFGFRKTGLGTMRITAPKLVQTHKSTKSGRGALSINGDPKVEEGELRVDGDLSLSDTIRVSNGAYLSGTGLVNNVSISQGGGLRVSDGQSHYLRIGGNISIEDSLKIEVLLPANADVRNVRANVITFTKPVENIGPILSASVFADGVLVPNIKLKYKDNKLSLRYMRGTTMVIR
jgi:autotransporter-associated beta strand protein